MPIMKKGAGVKIVILYVYNRKILNENGRNMAYYKRIMYWWRYAEKCL